MPNSTIQSADQVDLRLFDSLYKQPNVAPAVVTEFLIGCADCKRHFEYFPKLVPQIREAGFRTVNLAYMGNPGSIRRYFDEGNRDFGGQVFIDKGASIQRHFGIGTFTVWLLDQDGTIQFQGSPEQAEPYLAKHLKRRIAQRDGIAQSEDVEPQQADTGY